MEFHKARNLTPYTYHHAGNAEQAFQVAIMLPEAEIIVFGSRIHGTAKPWSDLDLAIKAESALDWKMLEEIKEAFQDSELPFRVDVLDWNDIMDAFCEAIEGSGYEMLG